MTEFIMIALVRDLNEALFFTHNNNKIIKCDKMWYQHWKADNRQSIVICMWDSSEIIAEREAIASDMMTRQKHHKNNGFEIQDLI